MKPPRDGKICRRCGLPVTEWRDGWKHASGGALGITPKWKRHVPEPMDAPRDDSRAIAALLRAQRRLLGTENNA